MLAVTHSIAHASGGFPSATALADESLAATDDARALLVNPAAIGQRYPSEWLLAYARRDSGHEWNAGLASWRRLGLGFTRERDSSLAFGLGISAGNERLRLGLAAIERVASAPQRERDLDARAGLLLRARPWASAGVSVAHLFQSEFRGRRTAREYTLGLALRPLAWSRRLAHDPATRFTLTADVTLAELAATRDARVRVGVAMEPVAGLELRAMAEGHGAFQLGVVLRGVRSSVHAAQARTRSGRAYESVALSAHAGEDRALMVPRGQRRVAHVRMAGVLADESIPGGLLGGGAGTPSAPLHRQLERALEDPLTRGVFLELGRVAGMAHLEELRPRLAKLRQAGKPVVAYMQYGGGRGDLYLASASSAVYASPAAEFVGLGLRTERRYYRHMLAGLGVKLDRSSTGDFKSGYRNYSVDSTPPADTTVIQRVLTQRQELFVTTVANGRRVAPERLLPVLDGRGHSAAILARLGVIDSVGWREQALAELGRRTGLGAKPRLADLRRAPRARTVWNTPERIAVVYAGGTIVDGRSGSNALDGGVMGDQTITAQLERAFKAPGIRAVVLRVESPGGTASASFLMDHAVERLRRETGKPVVVSMGSVAASGGYFLSAHADRIYANKHTVTGSIGVLFVKPSLEGLYAKLGVRQDEFDRGEYMRGLSLGRDWRPRDQAAADSAIKRHYRAFVERVSDGRKLERFETYAYAQGRVWLGEDAAERKLVDGIGGLDAAISEARRLGGIPQDERISLREYHRPRGTLLERIVGQWLSDRFAEAVSLPDFTRAQARSEEWLEDLE